mmetsp:Transcript_123467/g.283064  ORF Transcript_123467/g.283064 Transcript_123467/m.283064 type:complete len:421 (+) Transcript_123467:324-1586(+)
MPRCPPRYAATFSSLDRSPEQLQVAGLLASKRLSILGAISWCGSCSTSTFTESGSIGQDLLAAELVAVRNTGSTDRATTCGAPSGTVCGLLFHVGPPLCVPWYELQRAVDTTDQKTPLKYTQLRCSCPGVDREAAASWVLLALLRGLLEAVPRPTLRSAERVHEAHHSRARTLCFCNHQIPPGRRAQLFAWPRNPGTWHIHVAEGLTVTKATNTVRNCLVTSQVMLWHSVSLRFTFFNSEEAAAFRSWQRGYLRIGRHSTRVLTCERGVPAFRNCGGDTTRALTPPSFAIGNHIRAPAVAFRSPCPASGTSLYSTPRSAPRLRGLAPRQAGARGSVHDTFRCGWPIPPGLRCHRGLQTQATFFHRRRPRRLVLRAPATQCIAAGLPCIAAGLPSIARSPRSPQSRPELSCPTARLTAAEL